MPPSPLRRAVPLLLYRVGTLPTFIFNFSINVKLLKYRIILLITEKNSPQARRLSANRFVSRWMKQKDE